MLEPLTISMFSSKLDLISILRVQKVKIISKKSTRGREQLKIKNIYITLIFHKIDLVFCIYAKKVIVAYN